MNPIHWLELERREQDGFRAAVAFLAGRMERLDSIEWAIARATSNRVLRVAILYLLDSPAGRTIAEPWRSGWRFIQEFWNDRQVDYTGDSGGYEVKSRITAGERSASLVRELTALVAPRVSIEVHTQLTKNSGAKKRKPQSVMDLFAISMTSKQAIDSGLLELSEVGEAEFLSSVINALESSINEGLALGRRLGWDGGPELWRLGGLNRVYHVTPENRDGEEHEPDEFHQGISPSVKLLYAFIERLAQIEGATASLVVKRWANSNSPIFLRLWAAFARLPHLVTAQEVGSWLLKLSGEQFWLFNYFPEIAELRARRFADLDDETQKNVLARIRRLPPRKIWPYAPRGDDLKAQQISAAVRELLRIQAANGVLDLKTQQWLKTKSPGSLRKKASVRVEDGFPGTSKAYWVRPAPDARFDALAGDDRLDALAKALEAPRESWESDPAQRAADWLQQPQSISRILSDLEASKTNNKGTAALWERLGWSHTPQNSGAANEKEIRDIANRVLLLLADLPSHVLADAVDGISHWLSSWQSQVVMTKLGREVWKQVWPFAVEETNAQQPESDPSNLDATGRDLSGGRESDLDTLNTPVGKLVGVFLAGCPNLSKVKKPFSSGRPLRTMRDTIVASDGRSHLIALYRLIESLAYFFAADKPWTLRVLVAPLNAHTREANTLWRALGRRLQFKTVVQELGTNMMQRAVDPVLDRETREMLARNLVVECLHAYLDGRSEVVSPSGVQQMLRSVEDEVRANVAEIFARFVIDVSSSKDSSLTSEEIFEVSVTPFLKRVWPQESSLATAGVSKALAVLPAAANQAFADAVECIDRFLVPFDAWSMIEYGLYGDLNGRPKLDLVDDRRKATAFLKLLDKTVGSGERAVVPHELATALAHIRKIAQDLAETSSFRRLATMARR